MFLATTLSRGSPSRTTSEEETLDFLVITLKTAVIAILPPRLEELIDAAANDETLNKNVIYHHTRKLTQHL